MFFARPALVLCAILVAGSAFAQAKRNNPILPGGNSRAPVSIDAAKLDYFDKDQKLVYSGGVTAKQGDSTLKASSLVILLNKDTKEGEAAAAPGSNNSIRRIEAEGPVTITNKDQIGTGDKGVYDRVENKVYLIGNVVLSQGPNITKGNAESRLVYDLNTSQAQVIGGRVSSIFTPGSGGGDALKPKPKAEPKPANPQR